MLLGFFPFCDFGHVAHSRPDAHCLLLTLTLGRLSSHNLSYNRSQTLNLFFSKNNPKITSERKLTEHSKNCVKRSLIRSKENSIVNTNHSARSTSKMPLMSNSVQVNLYNRQERYFISYQLSLMIRCFYPSKLKVLFQRINSNGGIPKSEK